MDALEIVLVKHTLICWSLIAVAHVGHCDVEHGTTPKSAVVKEIFRDDFNGRTLDLTKWNPSHLRSEVNTELEYYTPAAVTVGGGVLKITANRTGENYTSGRVDTKDKFTFLYGDIEWRAKLPTGGKGIWPALWLEHPACDPAVSCVDWPPAVSVIDFRSDRPKDLVFTVFYKNADGGAASQDLKYNGTEDYSLNFYTYGLRWSRARLEWFLNGQSVFLIEDPKAIPSVKMQVVMNMAIGGVFPGNPDNTTHFPTDFLIDYVSVRQLQNLTQEPPAESSTLAFLAPLLGTLIPVVIIATAIAACCIWRRKRRWLHGDMRKQSHTDSVDTESTPAYSHYMLSDYMKGELAVQHYVNLLEIPSANLQISDHVLGRGEFGMVRKGVAKGLRGMPRPTVVAIKSVKNPQDEEQCRSLLEEMKTMTKAGRHLNIINLLGATIKGETLLLLEYCPHGNLLKYLESHRGTYYFTHVDPDGNILPVDQDQLDERQEMANRQQRRPSFAVDNFDNAVITTNDLVNFVYQVARGMDYLSTRSIIHRDLAARNVLVADDRIMKISDFGMARQQEEYVLENQQVALPVRWMSPEAITRKVFSQKTDVWSFGVLMWEVFALGETPYKNSGLSTYVQDFVLAIAQGFRMARPQTCPTVIYDIMGKCWDFNRDKRPTFSELEAQLRPLMEAECTEAYLTLDIPYQQFNVAHQDILDEVVSHVDKENDYVEA